MRLRLFKRLSAEVCKSCQCGFSFIKATNTFVFVFEYCNIPRVGQKVRHLQLTSPMNQLKKKEKQKLYK